MGTLLLSAVIGAPQLPPVPADLSVGLRFVADGVIDGICFDRESVVIEGVEGDAVWLRLDQANRRLLYAAIGPFKRSAVFRLAYPDGRHKLPLPKGRTG